MSTDSQPSSSSDAESPADAGAPGDATSESAPPSTVRLGLLIVLIAGVLGAAVWAVVNERAGDELAASIGDREYTVDQLTAVLADEPTNDGVIASPERAAERITNFLIVEAVADELTARDAPVTDGDTADAIAAVETDPQLLTDSTTEAGQQLVRERAVVFALQRYADEIAFAQAGDVVVPEYLCSSHVLVETEDEALDVIAELEGGLAFADAAVQFSTGPSGPNGGDLGCVDTAGFVVEFVVGARESGSGTVSPPVQSQFGWHVIQVRSIGELSAENHPEMSEAEISAALDEAALSSQQPIAQQAFDDVLQAAIETVRVGAYVNPRFGAWDPEVRFVVPPSGVSR
ncbi:MAG: peptidylprolyl isomerase [Actinomycetota bacterium]